MGTLGALDLILWRTQSLISCIIPSLLSNHRSTFRLIARDKKNQCILYKSKHYFITSRYPSNKPQHTTIARCMRILNPESGSSAGAATLVCQSRFNVVCKSICRTQLGPKKRNRRSEELLPNTS